MVSPGSNQRFGTLLRPLTVGLACLILGTGCQNVEFFERRLLADPIMALGDSPSETHFYQKTYYSREGSVGGIGSSAGGGCGCY